MPQQRGCGVLFYKVIGDVPHVLLFRRDNKPGIPFPGMLDILGGGIEEGEDARRAIVREMGEELKDLRKDAPFVLDKFEPFIAPYTDERGVEQTIFYAAADFETEDIKLLEGDELVWVTDSDMEWLNMAFDFASVVADFFRFIRTQ